LILVVCYQLGKDSLTNWRQITIAVCSVLVLFRFKDINSAFIIVGGAAMGYLLLL